MIALNGVVIVVVQPFVNKRLATFDRPKLLAGSMLIVGLGFGLGAVVHSWWGYAVSVVVWTIGEIGFAAVIGAIFADLAPVDLRGGYMGLAGSMSFGLGSRDRPTARHQHPRTRRREPPPGWAAPSSAPSSSSASWRWPRPSTAEPKPTPWPKLQRRGEVIRAAVAVVAAVRARAA